MHVKGLEHCLAHDKYSINGTGRRKRKVAVVLIRILCNNNYIGNNSILNNHIIILLIEIIIISKGHSSHSCIWDTCLICVVSKFNLLNGQLLQLVFIGSLGQLIIPMY